MIMAAAPTLTGRNRRVLRLRHVQDWQSLAYLAAFPALIIWQWLHGFSWPLYALLLFLTLGVGVIHHNHTHLRMWQGRTANRITDFYITLCQGHPSFVFWPTHCTNHHRNKHGEHDVARTYRFAGGDTNHLYGYLIHPFQAARVLYPTVFSWLVRMRRHYPGVWRYCMLQYGAWLGLWATVLAIDVQKGLLYVIIPQLHGLHWLLVTNYLQHAHADGSPESRRGQPLLNYARNFEGLVNPLLFNIGLHTAHHEHSRAHWSALTGLHWQYYRQRVAPQLNEPGLLPYMARVFIMGAIHRQYRSVPLMPSPAPQRNEETSTSFRSS